MRFADLSPEEFRAHVRGLRTERKARKPARKKKPKEFSFRVTKKGTLSLRVKREPKWLSEGEMLVISELSGKPLSEVFLRMKAGGILRSSEEEQRRIAEAIREGLK